MGLIFGISPLAIAVSAIKDQVVEVSVTERGFEPSSISVGSDKNVSLKVTRKTDATCATAIQVPSMHIKKELALNQAVIVQLGRLPKGEIRFGCGMNMMEAGKILVR